METLVTRKLIGYLMILQAIISQDRVGAQDTPYLIFTNRDDPTQGIRTANLDGTNVRTLVNNLTASGLDYDYRDRTLFWSNIRHKAIYMAAMDGSSRTLITNTTQNPETIAWDWINKKLYWTDVTRGTLEVIDPVTGYRKVLLNVTRDAQIRGIQLDPVNGWMYYTTIAPGRGMIAKISMDGTERMTLHDNSVVIFPNGITLDYTTDTLYWIDASPKYNLVGKSNVALGSPNMTVFTFQTPRTPFHTTYHNGGLYITDWRASSVLRLELDSTPELNEIVPRHGRTGMIRVVADSKQQYVLNPCRGAPCSHLCLLSSIDPRGYSCACNDGVKLNQDRVTCGNGSTSSPPTPSVPLPTATPSTPLPTTVTPSVPLPTATPSVPLSTATPSVPLSTSTTMFPSDGPCSSNPCKNGGTCVETKSPPSFSFQCQCASSYTGPVCGDPEQAPSTGLFTVDDNTVLIYVLGVLGILAFLAFLLIGLLVFAYWTMKLRSKSSKHRRRSSIDGISTSSRDSPPQFVLVNGHMSGRMSEHDYMSIKSRANSPAPSRILICNVGDQGSVPNNYIFEHPQLVRPPVTGGSQTLDHMFSTRGAAPEPRPNGQLPEPIYNTVKSTKRLTL